MRIEASTYDLNGHELVLRNATEDEAEMLLVYLKTTCRENKISGKGAGGDYDDAGGRARVYQKTE